MGLLDPTAVFRSEDAYSMLRGWEGKEMLGWGEEARQGQARGLPLPSLRAAGEAIQNCEALHFWIASLLRSSQ